MAKNLYIIFIFAFFNHLYHSLIYLPLLSDKYLSYSSWLFGPSMPNRKVEGNWTEGRCTKNTVKCNSFKIRPCSLVFPTTCHIVMKVCYLHRFLSISCVPSPETDTQEKIQRGVKSTKRSVPWWGAPEKDLPKQSSSFLVRMTKVCTLLILTVMSWLSPSQNMYSCISCMLV